jgi:purine-binding chemotaxis protein CheW
MKRADDLEGRQTGARPFLTFRVAERIYALPAELVAEVIHTPSVARVPQAPKALVGVANLRGAVLPLVSLRNLVGLDEVGQGDSSRAIVLGAGAPVALAVDAIDALVTVEAHHVQTQPASLSAEPGERLIGAFQLGSGRGAAKILEIKTLLSQAFAQRDRAPKQTAERASRMTARVSSEAVAPRESFITFEVASQEFAFSLEAVQEIISMPNDITAVPRAEALVLGMMAFRETLLPLFSLRALLGLPPATLSDGREKVVVVSVSGALVGLVVDRARAILSADPAAIEPTPAAITARSIGETRIKSIYRGENGRRLISILAPEQLFREDVVQRLNGEQRAMRPKAPSETLTEMSKFLVFRLGDDEFGLPVEAVDEVARAPAQITRVPKTPKFLEGVVNLRGEVLPVVDQRRRFDMPKSEHPERRRLIVVRSERHRAGLIVDSVSEVLAVAADVVEAAPELTGDITRLIRGVANLEREGRIILLLDPGELLTRAERGILDAFEANTRKSS